MPYQKFPHSVIVKCIFFQAFLFQLDISHVPNSVLTEGYSNAFTEREKKHIKPLKA